MKKTTGNSSLNTGFSDIVRNAEADAYASLLHRIRSELIRTMEASHFSRAQLAEKLGVSRSVITRVLDPTSDVLVSTIFDLAWALDKQWDITIRSNDLDVTTSVYFDSDDFSDDPHDLFNWENDSQEDPVPPMSAIEYTET